jgi:hypothetical protein
MGGERLSKGNKRAYEKKPEEFNIYVRNLKRRHKKSSWDYKKSELLVDVAGNSNPDIPTDLSGPKMMW